MQCVVCVRVSVRVGGVRGGSAVCSVYGKTDCRSLGAGDAPLASGSVCSDSAAGRGMTSALLTCWMKFAVYLAVSMQAHEKHCTDLSTAQHCRNTAPHNTDGTLHRTTLSEHCTAQHCRNTALEN
ncbi:hypothetical protein O3P69_019953 [Scylla paramamosain]|uniref:Secreted protein n=1 Tax=Scylla paramamosain TaxID=85552 RepID=A0AAW0SFS3_SCYPA